ncbi:MAG: hypothetical protein H0W89_00680 [Candidatus Levybacteria bacterium]|nr:hypothetical protein [Candidatus Levybacteria bacterium]
MKERIKLVFNWKFLSILLVVIIAGKYLGGEVGREVVIKDTHTSKASFDIKDWNSKQRQTAIDECIQTGSEKAYCTCSIDALDKKYSLSEMKALFKQTEEEGEAPVALTNIQEQCSVTPTSTNPYIKAVNQSRNNEYSDTVLPKYKLEIDTIKEQSEALLQPVLNNTEVACQSIVDAKDSEQHIYYMYLQAYNNLETKYGQYRNDSNYIDNSLNSWYRILIMVKAECSHVGYKI